MYAGNECFVLPLSHDEVVHGKRPLIGKMAGDTWQKLASIRLLFGYQWTLPGKKLLFMGDEIGVPREWNHDDQLDWWIGNQPAHANLARWLGDLNGAYRTLPALHVADCASDGMRWLVADDREHGVIAYLRLGGPNDAPVMIACNFTPVAREGYRIGVPRGGRWREALNSDAAIYGGGGIGNRGGMEAEAVQVGSHAWSLVITAPPLAVVVFVAET
jgi:1,4-alpha-glucan branching enzyme